MESIPELGSDPDIGASDFVLLERIADFVLVLWRNVVRHTETKPTYACTHSIDPCIIDTLISTFEGSLNKPVDGR